MPEPRTPTQHPTPVDGRWFAAAVIGLALLLVVKLLLAWQLPLFGDEAFYWLESRHLALAYSDLPPLTALLVRAGTAVAGHSYLGVRLAFLVLGALVPVLVWWLARRLAGAGAAWPAAAASACVPLAATLGVLALPDVPLVVLGLAGLAAFVRALDGDERRWWIAAGVLAALGLCAHYRFAALLIGPALFMVMTRTGRRRLVTAGPWLALLVACGGLVPIAWFNLTHDFAGIAFQLVERHPWQFNPEGWRYLPVQALIVTPLMFAALLAAFRPACRRWRDDPAAGAVVFFCAVMLAGFTLAAFFADSERTSAHWTLAGYLPLLAWLPAVQDRLPRWCRPWAPLTGLAGTAVMLGYLALAAHPGSIAAVTDAKAFPDNFTGWREAAAGVERRLALRGRMPVVAGNFMLAAELDFELPDVPRVYSLDHPLNRRHGRALQMALWGLDERGLREARAGERVLVVLEETTRKIGDRPAWVRRMCSRFDTVAFLGETRVADGRKRFLYFAGRVRGEPGPAPASAVPTEDCDLPPHAYLIEPRPGATVRGPTRVHGWAVEDNAGVARVTLLVDGEPAASTRRYFRYPDVARFLPGSVDPTHPRVGFELDWDPSGLAPGEHDIALRVVTRDGNMRILENRRVRVRPDQ